ncbi:hypothetical protein C8Q78DRAFT_229789 [Trametes maxima]|nr:hypothetical protein C8Q78DRAFT_229789 [Trametes maxima]
MTLRLAEETDGTVSVRRERSVRVGGATWSLRRTSSRGLYERAEGPVLAAQCTPFLFDHVVGDHGPHPHRQDSNSTPRQNRWGDCAQRQGASANFSSASTSREDGSTAQARPPGPENAQFLSGRRPMLGQPGCALPVRRGHAQGDTQRRPRCVACRGYHAVYHRCQRGTGEVSTGSLGPCVSATASPHGINCNTQKRECGCRGLYLRHATSNLWGVCRNTCKECTSV